MNHGDTETQRAKGKRAVIFPCLCVSVVHRLLRGLWLGAALFFAATATHAAWTPPNAHELERLERALASLHAAYDPAEQMVRRPFSSPGYHTALKGGFVHPTRDSLYYALGLLDTGKSENLDRAVAILRRVVALQDTDPARKTYGIWSWFLEEPLDRMSPPDWNWADFNGVTLLQVARDHRERLPSEVARAVEAAIVHAARSIQQRNVRPGYTNIAIMGTYVTLVAGELFQLPEFERYGLERLARIQAFTTANGGFEEYNSPTYTVVALFELSRLKAHVRTPAAGPMIDALLRRAWEEVATHFHAPTRQWTGPQSRAYSSLTRDSTLALLQRATAGRINFGVDLPDREDRRLPVACPRDLEPLFLTLTAPRTLVETLVRATNTIGTTYLEPGFALGSINRGDLWHQRRALLLHFGTAAAPGYVRLRFLKDDYDFASAYLTAAQRGGLVVGAVNLVTNGGDTHISLAKVKDAKFRARDLRLRFEIGGPAAESVRIDLAASADRATLTATDLSIHIDIVRAQLGERAGTLVAGRDQKLGTLDVVLHDGAEREFNLAALEQAIVGFVFSCGPHGRIESKVAGGSLAVACDGLSIAVPIKPAPR